MKRFILLLVLIASFVLSSCTGSLPSPAPKPASTSPVITPVAGKNAVSPVATSAAAMSALSPIPTPVAGQGVVAGILIDKPTGQVAPETILYLEHSINHSAPPLLYGPLNNQPRTTSLKNGQFVITNVPPGEYVLALYSPIDILYYQQADGSAVLIQVKSGEINDLGKVYSYIP